jgi:acyl-CoA synthetase (AMP-forming)/AMP-acid ligase II
MTKDTLWGLADHRGQTTPDDLMMVDEDDRTMTFAEYRHAALAVAAGFAEIGVKAETVVAWQLPTSLEAMVIMAALSRLGAVQAPLLPILRESEVSFIARQLRVEVLVVPSVFRSFDHGAMAASVASLLGCAVVVSDHLAQGHGALALPSGDPDTLPPVGSTDAEATRWVYYTSGTTAEPKGVRHTESSALATSVHLITGLNLVSGDVTPLVSPVSHVGGIMTLATQLMTGFQTVLSRSFDAETTPPLMAKHGTTVVRGAVPVLRALVAAQLAKGTEPLLPALRAVQCGGAARPVDLHHQMRDMFGLEGVLSSYGMTECPGVTSLTPADTEEHIRLTSGTACPGVEISVVDALGTVCPAGVEGELLVRGPQMFSGYVNATLDVGAFDERGFFRSGDLGIVDAEGYVRITGRIKDIIIRNAENISALEVEDLLSTHPDIADVAVIGLPDQRTGERCVAIVELAWGATALTLHELARFCTERGLAKQKIPEQVELIDALPRNAMGKIEKQKLRTRYLPSGESVVDARGPV